ncbi:MAG TPA: hypothetical protein VFH70_11785 [Acidimicrobiales bacterium]|nr:hypothetical protein [Acidimicrobiales bacterium]
MLAAGTLTRARSDRRTSAGLAPVALLAAVGFGVIAQGGYYAPQLAIMTALLCAAAGLGGLAAAWHPAVLGALGLAAMAALSGGVAGDIGGSWMMVATCVCAGTAVIVGRSLDTVERQMVVSGLVLGGTVVSALAWAGVAFHLQPFALVDGGLWRGASGLTYANATAGFLVPLALMALARLADRRQVPSRAWSLGTYLILVGVGSTLSRGGALGLVTGAVALMAMLGWRRCLATWAPLALGAVAGLAGLAASMSQSSHPSPLISGGALAVGALVAMAGRSLPERAVPWLLAGAILVIPLVVVFTPGRWNASSPDRAHETHAALATIASSPVLGVSPGRYLLTWNDPVLGPRAVQYAHDEYLQMAGEIGLAGLALGALAAGLTARSAWRARVRAASWCGPIAGLAALAVHSGLDFLWHIPLIVVLAGLLVGLVVPPRTTHKEIAACTSPR